ncbi:hypothetical protein D3C80_952650 [compost metagenome]
MHIHPQDQPLCYRPQKLFLDPKYSLFHARKDNRCYSKKLHAPFRRNAHSMQFLFSGPENAYFHYRYLYRYYQVHTYCFHCPDQLKM